MSATDPYLKRATGHASERYPPARAAIRTVRRELTKLSTGAMMLRNDLEDERTDHVSEFVQHHFAEEDDKQKTVTRLAGEAADKLALLAQHLLDIEAFHAGFVTAPTMERATADPIAEPQ